MVGFFISPFEIHGHRVEDSLVVKDLEDSFMKERKANIPGVLGKSLMIQILMLMEFQHEMD